MNDVIYLSRRNLLALLSKLDRAEAGEETACTIIKYQAISNRYAQSMDECHVVAIEDEEYYGAQKRSAGTMHPKDGGVYESNYST